MDRKEDIRTYMESPLYFTMSVQKRLEFLKRRKWRACFANYLREDLLNWVRTGNFNSATSATSLSDPYDQP
jgi:hypothetical protein